MRKKFALFALAIVMTLGVCSAALVGCGEDEAKTDKFFAQETEFHVDLSMSTVLGPLGNFCHPGSITFKTDGKARFDIPFNDTAYVQMDEILKFRIPDFKHDDTYELNADKTAITYHSTRKGFEEPMNIPIEYLSDGSMKFTFDLGVQIPNTVLYFYSNPDQMPEQPADKPQPIKVLYDVDVDALKPGSEESLPPAAEILTSAKAITLPDLDYTMDGTLFRGWVIDGETFQPEGKTVYKPGDKYFADKTVTFVPFFDKFINVTFRDPNGLSYTSQYPYGTNMTMPDCFFHNATPTGYGFAYWVLEGDKAQSKRYPRTSKLYSSSTKKDLVINAVFTKTVEINFIPGVGGNGTAFAIKAPIDSKIMLPDCAFASADENKGFAGWKINGEGSVKPVNSEYTVKEGDFIEAYWNDLVTVTYKAESDSVEGNVRTAKVVKNSSFYVPTNVFTKTDYHFTHWIDAGETAEDKTKYYPGKKITLSKDTTFIANWAINVKLSFVTGVEGKTVADIKQGSNDKQATMPRIGCKNGDKKFGGWSDGTTIYQTGDKYTYGDSDVTFTAVWLEKMTVQFAGGTGATGEVTSIETYETEQITLPENGFTKDGFAFGGWTDGTATYLAGDKYTVPKKTDSNTITLNAVWVKGQFAPYIAVFRVEHMDTIIVKGEVTLQSIMSMTELKLYPDKTADFKLKFKEDKDLTKQIAALNTTIDALRALEKDLRGIPYDYDKDASTLTLTPSEGAPIVLTITKAAKDAAAGRLFDQVSFTYAFPVGDLTGITFTTYDGEPLYLNEPATFEVKGIKIGSFTADATLKIATDGTGELMIDTLIDMKLTFYHYFVDNYTALVWLGDSGELVQAAVTTNSDGKRVITVSMLGNTVSLTEKAA